MTNPPQIPQIKRQLAYKPGSVHMGCPTLDSHSSGTFVAKRFVQPTRVTKPETALVFDHQRHPYSVLLQVGFA